MVEADVDVQSTQGDLVLDLVKGGKHFTCTIDVATGKAKMSVEGAADFGPTAATPISKPGRYHVALANVDDQMLLWVDGNVVKFDASTEFDAGELFGGREKIIPKTGAADPGDLAPAGIGSQRRQAHYITAPSLAR